MNEGKRRSSARVSAVMGSDATRPGSGRKRSASAASADDQMDDPIIEHRSDSISPTPTVGTAPRPSPAPDSVERGAPQQRLRRPMNSFLLFSNEYRAPSSELWPSEGEQRSFRGGAAARRAMLTPGPQWHCMRPSSSIWRRPPCTYTLPFTPFTTLALFLLPPAGPKIAAANSELQASASKTRPRVAPTPAPTHGAPPPSPSQPDSWCPAFPHCRTNAAVSVLLGERWKALPLGATRPHHPHHTPRNLITARCPARASGTPTLPPAPSLSLSLSLSLSHTVMQGAYTSKYQ